MGSDVTKDGIAWQFRPIKRYAKALGAAVAAGDDPKDVEFNKSACTCVFFYFPFCLAHLSQLHTHKEVRTVINVQQN